MKKFAMLLAAGVIALGASAQAASVASTDTYAVITIPVYAGKNLIGVSVDALGGELAPVTNLLTVAPTDTLEVPDGAGYAQPRADAHVAAAGDAFWYSVSENGPEVIYEFGLESTAAKTVRVVGGTPVMAATGKTTSWTPASLTAFESNSGVSANRYANMINVWDAAQQKYIQLWYRTGTGWLNRATGTTAQGTYEIHPGQGVFLRPGASFETADISL